MLIVGVLGLVALIVAGIGATVGLGIGALFGLPAFYSALAGAIGALVLTTLYHAQPSASEQL